MMFEKTFGLRLTSGIPFVTVAGHGQVSDGCAN